MKTNRDFRKQANEKVAKNIKRVTKDYWFCLDGLPTITGTIFKTLNIINN